MKCHLYDHEKFYQVPLNVNSVVFYKMSIENENELSTSEDFETHLYKFVKANTHVIRGKKRNEKM